AVALPTSPWPRRRVAAVARLAASPRASSIELVEVPVSVIVFATIEVSSRRRRAPPPTFHYRRGSRRRCKLGRSFFAREPPSLSPSRQPGQQRRVGRERERRRGGRIEPADG